MKAHRFEVTDTGRVALASECTTPSIGDHHPAALALHALNNAAQIALALAKPDDVDVASVDECNEVSGRLAELLTTTAEHVAKLQELLERQERVIEEQRLECLREKRYSTRVEHKNSELTQSVITLTRQLEASGFDTSILPRTAVGASA